MFEVVFLVMITVGVVMFIAIVTIIFSPKVRAKFLGMQVKSAKYMFDENKENLQHIAETVGDIGIGAAHSTVKKNASKIKETSDIMAEANKDAVTTTVGAVRTGIGRELYCKHCGSSIDKDSTFCKFCGKKQ